MTTRLSGSATTLLLPPASVTPYSKSPVDALWLKATPPRPSGTSCQPSSESAQARSLAGRALTDFEKM